MPGVIRPCRWPKLRRMVGRSSRWESGVCAVPRPPEAGRLLAQRLSDLRSEEPTVVGLPRGGVPVAAQVADACGR